MVIYRKVINGMLMVMERKILVPNVIIFMISIENDPKQFPMVNKKEYGGWFFVDKMTPIEFKEIEQEISDFLEEQPAPAGAVSV